MKFRIGDLVKRKENTPWSMFYGTVIEIRRNTRVAPYRVETNEGRHEYHSARDMEYQDQERNEVTQMPRRTTTPTEPTTEVADHSHIDIVIAGTGFSATAHDWEEARAIVISTAMLFHINITSFTLEKDGVDYSPKVVFSTS